MILFCHDFEKAGVYKCEYCCSSCHEDAELGYSDLVEVEPPDKNGEEQYTKSPGTFALACCGFRDWEPTRSDWVKAILVKRGESQ